MIIYPTKQTIERYNIPAFEELDDVGKIISQQVISDENDDQLLQWGCKLLYFVKRKYLKFANGDILVQKPNFTYSTPTI